jgi:hypothetical protein
MLLAVGIAVAAAPLPTASVAMGLQEWQAASTMLGEESLQA